MKKISFSLCFLLIIIFQITGQQISKGIIYGTDWSFVFSSPIGFKWDNTTLRKQGIWALFYPISQEKYYGSKLNIYIQPVPKGGDYPSDTDSLIKWDTEYFKSKNPGLTTNYYKEVKLGDNNIAKVYTFDDDTRMYNMLYGYVTEKTSSFIFVLIARSQEERKANEASYEELLKSFVFIETKP